MNDLAKRIKIALKDESVLSFSKRCGVGESSLRQYIAGAVPGLDKVILIAKAADVSLEWLATGDGTPYTNSGFHHAQSGFSRDKFENIAGEMPQSELVKIPIMNVPASAGGGSVVTTEDIDGHLAFDPVWLHKTGLNRAETFTIPTIGESMEPTIKAGEYLLCSRAEHHVSIGDGIYVIRLEGNILVKRLQVLPGGLLEVSSDNAQFYKSFTLDMKIDADFKILGKVVFVHGIRQI